MHGDLSCVNSTCELLVGRIYNNNNNNNKKKNKNKNKNNNNNNNNNKNKNNNNPGRNPDRILFRILSRSYC